jgi:23S rRNA (uracil1939-C5)-methyltransferase
VLPGERVSVEPVRDAKGVFWHRVKDVLEPSPDRVTPRCPHFGKCGGCQYQHARYETQLQLKTAILREQLLRMGRLTYEGEVRVISGPEYDYRNRCQFQITDGKLGYFEQGSNDLIPISECPIASPVIWDAIAKIRTILPRFVSRLELFTNGVDVQLNILRSEKPVARRFFDECAKLVPGADRPHLDYAVGSDVYRVNHKSFFQVNRFLIEPLVKAVVDGESGKEVFDLYAGVGLFTLPLARQCQKVTSVEIGGSANGDLQFNLERAKLKARGVFNRAEDWLAEASVTPDLIVADPPRTGLGKAVVKELLRLKAPRLTVVSCDPATLARDLQALLAGGYEIADLTLIDMFPQTFHLETIAKLRLR